MNASIFWGWHIVSFSLTASRNAADNVSHNSDWPRLQFRLVTHAAVSNGDGHRLRQTLCGSVTYDLNARLQHRQVAELVVACGSNERTVPMYLHEQSTSHIQAMQFKATCCCCMRETSPSITLHAIWPRAMHIDNIHITISILHFTQQIFCWWTFVLHRICCFDLDIAWCCLLWFCTSTRFKQSVKCFRNVLIRPLLEDVSCIRGLLGISSKTWICTKTIYQQSAHCPGRHVSLS